MQNLMLTMLLITSVKAGDGLLQQSAPPLQTLSPVADVDSSGSSDYPAASGHVQRVDLEDESPPESLQPVIEHGLGVTSIAMYPYFAELKVIKDDVVNRNEALSEWEGFYRRGVIISKNYVVHAGLMCNNCTYFVNVDGSRHKAKPIPYNDDWQNRTGALLMLLRLRSEIVFGPEAQPVQLPNVGDTPKSGDHGILISPSIYLQGSVINLSNRTVVSQQDCNERIRSSIKRFSYQIVDLPPFQQNTTEVPTGSFCVTESPERASFLGSDFSMLLIEGKFAGIGFHKIHVMPYPRKEYDYVFHYDIAYYRNWIRNITGV